MSWAVLEPVATDPCLPLAFGGADGFAVGSLFGLGTVDLLPTSNLEQEVPSCLQWLISLSQSLLGLLQRMQLPALS